MERLETLWSAFKNIAVLFSFAVCFVLVMVLLLLAIGVLTIAPALPGLQSGTICPLIADINGLVNDLDNAVINRTIQISTTIPVVFDLPLRTNTNVSLTEGVTLNRPTSFTLPAGGGRDGAGGARPAAAGGAQRDGAGPAQKPDEPGAVRWRLPRGGRARAA